MFGREGHALASTQDPQIPGISLARCDAPGFGGHRKCLAMPIDLAVEGGIVSGFTGDFLTVTAGTLLYDIGLLGLDGFRLPNQSRRDR